MQIEVRGFVAYIGMCVSLLFLLNPFFYSPLQSAGVQSVKTALANIGNPYLRDLQRGFASTSAGALVPTREIHIGNNGSVLLRNATVTAYAGGVWYVSVPLGDAHFSWIVSIDNDTKLFNGKGERDATFLKVGETVTVTGKLRRGGVAPEITASYIRAFTDPRIAYSRTAEIHDQFTKPLIGLNVHGEDDKKESTQ